MSGTVTFAYGATSVELPCPNMPYSSFISMAIDSIRLDDGTIDAYDNGGTYDKRWCDCEWDLTATEANSLIGLLSDTGRGADLTMTLSSVSGFHPFGPDKGDTGAFTVAVELVENAGIQDEPFLYHKIRLRIHNTGSYPAYSIPAEVNDGTSAFQIGTVTNLRFPPDRFSPAVEYAVTATIKEGAASAWIDRGSDGDRYESEFQLVCNQTKCAKVIEYLVGTARGNTFTMITDSNFYAFARDKGSSDTYTVMLLKYDFEITHHEYNQFVFNLSMLFVSSGG